MSMLRKIKLSDRPIFGIILILLVNILAVLIVLAINELMRFNSNLFILAFILLGLVLLLINVLFLVTYINRNRFAKRMMIILGCTFLILGGPGLGVYQSLRAKINASFQDQMNNALNFSVVSLDASQTDISAIRDQKIGLLNSTTETTDKITTAIQSYGYQTEIVSENDYSALLADLRDNSIQFAIIPSDYKTSLSQLGTIVTELNQVATFSIDVQATTNTGSTNLTKQPWTLAIFGTNEGLPDSIMIASFNPSTLKFTLTSIPRDSYVPISCHNNVLDKLNHTYVFGNGTLDCTMKTIENVLNIKIDNYVKIDFDAIVNVVDSLGGLELTVDHEITGTYMPGSDLSKIHWVTVPAGTNLLTGEQVLTFVRERYSYADGDFARQRNQQYVIQELMKKVLSTRDINTVYNLMSVASKYMTTSLTDSDMISFASFALDQITAYPLDGLDAFRIETSRVTGNSDLLYSPGDGADASVVKLYSQSIKDISAIINGNLATTPTLGEQQTMSFDSNTKYVAPQNYQVYYSSGYQWP